jgi:S-adenosylmethionine decarboxylase
LANTFILVSSALTVSVMGAAIAVQTATNRFAWFKKLFSGKDLKKDAAVAAPVVTRDEGWMLIRCDDPESFGVWLGKDETGMPFGDEEEPSLGSHLLIELFGCDQKSLELEKSVGLAMNDAATESEATVVAQSFHEFKPYGVSGAVIIQESHYTIHTWPEHGYAAVDLFYCGGTVKVHKAVDILRERFKPERIKFLVVRRGLQSEVER